MSNSKWKKIWPIHDNTRSVKVQLVIHDLKSLPIPSSGLTKDTSAAENLIVRIEWKGLKNGRALLPKGAPKNCTSRQGIKPDGSVNWDEGFDHDCKIKLMDDSQSFKSWFIHLEVQEMNQKTNASTSVLAKAEIDIAEFVSATTSKSTISLPVNCTFRGTTAEATLTMELNFFDVQSKGSNGSVYPLASCMRLPQHHRKTSKDFDDRPEKNEASTSTSPPKHSIDSSAISQAEEEPALGYRNLTATNILLVDLENTKTESVKQGKREQLPADQQIKAPRAKLIRRLSWNRKKPLNFRSLSHPRDTPLLNKSNGEGGGDDIDNDRRYQLIPPEQNPVQDNTTKVSNNAFQDSEFAGSDRFEIGDWEEKKLVSRDGKIELDAKVFLASIDQRSEKAAGESACTVLVAVIAYWLHQNPRTLPLKCELDKLVREGSSEWRNLCEKEIHWNTFADRHFDLDTVLQEKIRPLSVVTEKSYVGFFKVSDNTEHLEYMQGALSFDDIWEELQKNEATSEEQVYILSWNDHFFVLKVEAETIYIIDTLGERLYEGCDKAYILMFNKDSRISRILPKESTGNTKTKDKAETNGRSKEKAETKAKSKEKAETNTKSKEKAETNAKSKDKAETNVKLKEKAETNAEAAGRQVGDQTPREIISEGKAACKDYIKEFLASLPLRELQEEIERGGTVQSSLHHRLQIDCHYTAPCT
ncbi:hypothetical protein C5167_046589 [Papaver somniferum]|uniref:C2 NT-type domain-containing protein n=1 Tax=Papaver somniferum TaxID=3469 RepID=A0A4Y7LGX0_PAPSO|nr:uncharacterized protein LOC113322393 [Papaver somniferum]RZC83798.1 hypothetical protein C5167_046589 [Papaver somniferum]